MQKRSAAKRATRRRAQAALFAAFVLAYLCVLLYFLMIRPGGSAGNPVVIWALTSFAAGGMLFMAIFALMLYQFRPKDKAALYFALMCVRACARFFFMEGSLTILGLIPAFPHNAIYALRYIAIGCFIAGITGFIYERFTPQKRLRKPFLTFSAITVAAYALHAVIAAVQNGDDALTRLIIIIPTFAVQVFSLFIIVRSPAFKANRLNQFYFATIVAYMAETVLLGLFVDQFANLGVVTQSFFVIVHTVLLSKRYSSAINENELLSKLNKTKRDFLQDMNHELRTPLAVIATSVTLAQKLIEENGNKQKTVVSLEIAHDEALRVGSMLDGLSALAHMSDKVENRERVGFAELLRQCAEHALPAAQRWRNELHVNIAEGLPDVFIESDQYANVIARLFINAVKSTTNGKITLSANLDGASIVVRLADTGEGIPKELLPRIFKPGAADSDGADYELHMCKSVVEAHGGTIAVESAPGNGTAVTFTVPVYSGQEAGH